MKVKINLDTKSALMKFIEIASKLNEKITLTDNNNFKVSGKSVLGAAYASMEFEEIWLETENERYFEFGEFIINE